MKHTISAHSPFMPRHSGPCLLAVCDEAKKEDIINSIAEILNAAEALLYQLSHQDEERSFALYGIAHLVEIAKGLTESLKTD